MYLGLPLGALALEAAGFEIVATLLGDRIAPGTRRLRRRGRPDRLLLARPDLYDPATLHLLEGLRPDLLLSFFFPRKIPSRLLDSAPLGAFGTHPSLLPRWRGPDPYFWALREGDAQTGVTLHRLAAEYDVGPIVEQRPLPILPADDAWSLARRLDRPALELLVEIAARLRAGERPAERPQDEALATSAPSPDEALLAIDWKASVASILRLVRAAAPWPGASALLETRYVEILRASPAKGLAPGGIRAGEAFRCEGGVAVRAGDGSVRLERVRLDGEIVDPALLLGLER